MNPENITELATLLVYGLIFGVSMWIGFKLIVAGTSARRIRLDKPSWWVYSIVIAGVITGAIWYVCSIYLTTNPVSTAVDWIVGLVS